MVPLMISTGSVGPCEPLQFRLRVAHRAKGLCLGPSEVNTGQSAAPDNTQSTEAAAAANYTT